MLLNGKDSDLRAFQADQRQAARCVGTRVDIQSIGPQIRLAYRRVSMNDELAEVGFTRQELIADPQQVVFALLFEGHARSHASMDKKEITTGEGCRQFLQKSFVFCRHGAIKRAYQRYLLFGAGIHGRGHAIRHQRKQTAIVTPALKSCRILEHLEEDRFVRQTVSWVWLRSIRRSRTAREFGPLST